MKMVCKWVALGLLWITYFLLPGTRQIYGATLSQIRADFGVDDVKVAAFDVRPLDVERFFAAELSAGAVIHAQTEEDGLYANCPGCMIIIR